VGLAWVLGYPLQCQTRSSALHLPSSTPDNALAQFNVAQLESAPSPQSAGGDPRAPPSASACVTSVHNALGSAIIRGLARKRRSPTSCPLGRRTPGEPTRSSVLTRRDSTIPGAISPRRPHQAPSTDGLSSIPDLGNERVQGPNPEFRPLLVPPATRQKALPDRSFRRCHLLLNIPFPEGRRPQEIVTRSPGSIAGAGTACSADRSTFRRGGPAAQVRPVRSASYTDSRALDWLVALPVARGAATSRTPCADDRAIKQPTTLTFWSILSMTVPLRPWTSRALARANGRDATRARHAAGKAPRFFRNLRSKRIRDMNLGGGTCCQCSRRRTDS